MEHAVLLNMFKCPICQKLLREPMTIPCLHAFCKECIEDHIARVHNCPVCGDIVNVTKKDIKSDVTYRSWLANLFPPEATKPKTDGAIGESTEQAPLVTPFELPSIEVVLMEDNRSHQFHVKLDRPHLKTVENCSVANLLAFISKQLGCIETDVILSTYRNSTTPLKPHQTLRSLPSEDKNRGLVKLIYRKKSDYGGR